MFLSYSAKKLVSDTAALVIDWPNIYDCSMFLVCACLGLCAKSTDDFRAVVTVLSKAPNGHAEKYMETFQRHCPLPSGELDELTGKLLSSRKSVTNDIGSLPASGKLSFFRSPDTVQDRFIRPVSQQDDSVTSSLPKKDGKFPKFRYTREQLLDVERKTKGSPLPANMVDLGWVGEREKQHYGKRPRYVSESATQPDEGSKRILESTSPHLPLVIGVAGDIANHGRPHFEVNRLHL